MANTPLVFNSQTALLAEDMTALLGSDAASIEKAVGWVMGANGLMTPYGYDRSLTAGGLQATGTGAGHWFRMGTMHRLGRTAIGSSTSQVDFTWDNTYEYDEIRVAGAHIDISGGGEVLARVSQDGGSTFLAGSDYSYARADTFTGGSSITQADNTGETSMRFCTAPGSGGYVSFTATIIQPHTTTSTKPWATTSQGDRNGAATGVRMSFGATKYTANTSAINGVRLLPQSGTFDGGEFTLIGVIYGS